MDISDDSIIAPSGVITSTGNIPSEVMINRAIATNANDELNISLYQGNNENHDECLIQDPIVKRKQNDDLYDLVIQISLV